MKYLLGKITQQSGDDIFVQMFHNGFAPLTWAHTGTGEITGTANTPVFNNDYPPEWFNADNLGSRYSVTQINATQILIQCYDADGLSTDNILNGNKIFVEQ